MYYASRKLSGPESRYAAIEIEALAVAWGVNRFRMFVNGTSFAVITYHKPLIVVFKPAYCLANANLRVQKLVLKNKDLSLTVAYRPGTQNHIAGALSRLLVEPADPTDALVHAVTLANGFPTPQRKRVAELTAQDDTLTAVRTALETSRWPKTATLAPFEALRHELSFWPYPNSNGFVICRGDRLVIPPAAVDSVLRLAHDRHPGHDKTLQRLRECVWWPGWSKDARRMLEECTPCITNASVRPVPLKPRELPPHVWYTISVDVFYYLGIPFLSCLDSYSRYPAVVRLSLETTAAITKACDQIFALFGAPRRLISDNGPQFTSTMFKLFLDDQGVYHERTVPYAPRQNPVERFHRTVKQLMRKSGKSNAAEALRVALHTIRSTVNTATGKSPGDLFLRGGFRTTLQQLSPTSDATSEDDEELHDAVRISDMQAKAIPKTTFASRHHAQDRVLVLGQSVFIKQPSGATETGTVVKASPHDAVIEAQSGSVQRRHLDRIQPQPGSSQSQPDDHADGTTSADSATQSSPAESSESESESSSSPSSAEKVQHPLPTSTSNERPQSRTQYDRVAKSTTTARPGRKP